MNTTYFLNTFLPNVASISERIEGVNILYGKDFHSDFVGPFQEVSRGNICSYLSILNIHDLTEEECVIMLDGVLTQGLYGTFNYFFDIIYSNLDFYFLLSSKYTGPLSPCQGNYWECSLYKAEVWMYIIGTNLNAIMFMFHRTIQELLSHLSQLSNDYSKRILSDAYNRNLIMLIIIIVTVIVFEVVCFIMSYRINSQVLIVVMLGQKTWSCSLSHSSQICHQ